MKALASRARPPATLTAGANRSAGSHGKVEFTRSGLCGLFLGKLDLSDADQSEEEVAG